MTGTPEPDGRTPGERLRDEVVRQLDEAHRTRADEWHTAPARDYVAALSEHQVPEEPRTRVHRFRERDVHPLGDAAFWQDAASTHPTWLHVMPCPLEGGGMIAVVDRSRASCPPEHDPWAAGELLLTMSGQRLSDTVGAVVLPDG